MANYSVTSAQPISIYPAGQQKAVTIRNNDSKNHVFLDNIASGVGAFDLGPGSSMEWSAGNPLYAYVIASAPVDISILDNAGNLFDASAIAAQVYISGAPPVDVLT